MQNDQFQEIVWQKGRELYRDMPWRQNTTPYNVMVSEIMLQQTQVSRVVPKFEAFMRKFPTTEQLAEASLAEVIVLWQGLGYNRRAKYLHDAATMLVAEFDGDFPDDIAQLMRLPGIGKNTAGAIAAYSFNQSSIFIETNIRTVYIHHFFADDFGVNDKAIRQKLKQTVDRTHPREWYWALMDYGSYLKANGIKNISQSKHYKKQSALEGSLRQMRGTIIRQLSQSSMSRAELLRSVEHDKRLRPALDGLLLDGLVEETSGVLHLTK